MEKAGQKQKVLKLRIFMNNMAINTIASEVIISISII